MPHIWVKQLLQNTDPGQHSVLHWSDTSESGLAFMAMRRIQSVADVLIWQNLFCNLNRCCQTRQDGMHWSNTGAMYPLHTPWRWSIRLMCERMAPFFHLRRVCQNWSYFFFDYVLRDARLIVYSHFSAKLKCCICLLENLADTAFSLYTAVHRTDSWSTTSLHAMWTS